MPMFKLAGFGPRERCTPHSGIDAAPLSFSLTSFSLQVVEDDLLVHGQAVSVISHLRAELVQGFHGSVTVRIRLVRFPVLVFEGTLVTKAVTEQLGQVSCASVRLSPLVVLVVPSWSLLLFGICLFLLRCRLLFTSFTFSFGCFFLNFLFLGL